MKAGQTEFEVGTRIRIKTIRGEGRELSGLTGTITHPFAFGETKKGWVGVYLDAGQTETPWGGKCNLSTKEFEVIN